MIGFETDVPALLLYRIAHVCLVYAALHSGYTIRSAMRASGWRRAWIRFTTASMWLVAIAATFLPVPKVADEPARTVRFALDLVLTWTVIALYVAEDRISAWIRARPRGNVALVLEFNRISTAAGAVETTTDRERVDEDLANLDNFVRPETFEFIQLARSRMLAWFDGGPLRAEREERWSARMDELARDLIPPWRPDRLTAVRNLVLRASEVLAFGCGLVVGRSVLLAPAWLAASATLVLGYLVVWTWNRALIPGWLGAALGLLLTNILIGAHLDATTFTIDLVFIGMAALAAAYVRWVVTDRRPALRLVPPPEAGAGAGTDVRATEPAEGA